MADRLGRIEAKIDKMHDSLASINITLAAQHETLVDHTKRSTQLEDRVDPLEKSHYMMMGIIKAAGIVVTAVGFVAGVFEILASVHHIK